MADWKAQMWAVYLVVMMVRCCSESVRSEIRIKV